MRISTPWLLAAGSLFFLPAPVLAQTPRAVAARTVQPLTQALAELNRLYGT